jgi:hypothetical protein
MSYSGKARFRHEGGFSVPGLLLCSLLITFSPARRANPVAVAPYVQYHGHIHLWQALKHVEQELEELYYQ